MATLWTTIGLGMSRAGLGVTDDRPISYLGTDPRGAFLFRGGLALAAVAFVGFAWEVHQRLRRAAGFLAVFLVGMAGQVVVAAVRIDGSGHAVHTTAGIVLGLSLPLLMWRFAVGQPPGVWRGPSYGLMGLEVAACLVGVALSVAGLATLAEVAPAAAFHLWTIVVTLRWPAWPAWPAANEPSPVV